MSRIPRVLIVSLAAAAGFAQPAAQSQPQRYVEDVKFLASPDLQGRGAGTRGLERAASFIEDRFKSLKLQPAGEAGSYRQPLQVTTGAKPGAENRMETSEGRLRMNTDFVPLSFSSNGEANAPVVFAGYGVTASEFQYDDYQGVDVKDKVVLVLRYEPKSFQKPGQEKATAWTHHASIVNKAINARNHGAKAMILVDTQSKDDELLKFGAVSGPENAGILIAQVRKSVVSEWLKPSGKSLPESQAQPSSFALPDSFRLNIKVDVRREQATVRNVAAFLPGRSNEYVIIGAHYDHLGLGNESSLAPSQIGQVHPGADDNASGTAGLLEIARLLAARQAELNRGVLFLAFAGEEIGLLGSAHWVKQPTRPVDSAVAMINLDMIGRVNGSKLYVGGTGTGSNFEPMLKELTSRYKFQIETSADGYSSSDHTSFVGKGIPVLFFFSGLHGDYHKPSDTWEKIDGPASTQVVNLVSDIALRLAGTAERPKFVKVETNPHAGGGVPAGGGYGPYFGSVPDFAQVPKGVKFSDVRPGSPAGKAGLKAGDILIGFGDKPVNNLYDFTYALRNSKVGDVVTVKFLRDGQEMTAQVTLEARR